MKRLFKIDGQDELFRADENEKHLYITSYDISISSGPVLVDFINHNKIRKVTLDGPRLLQINVNFLKDCSSLEFVEIPGNVCVIEPGFLANVNDVDCVVNFD
jgi:hypothetical protein